MRANVGKSSLLEVSSCVQNLMTRDTIAKSKIKINMFFFNYEIQNGAHKKGSPGSQTKRVFIDFVHGALPLVSVQIGICALGI